MTCIELLEQRIRDLVRDNGRLIRVDIHTVDCTTCGYPHHRQPSVIIIIGRHGLTASELEQGREPPRGCDPVAPGEGAEYHWRRISLRQRRRPEGLTRCRGGASRKFPSQACR